MATDLQNRTALRLQDEKNAREIRIKRNREDTAIKAVVNEAASFE